MARDIEAAATLSELEGCRLVQGDVTDRSSVLKACGSSPFDAVISCHGVRPPRFSRFKDLLPGSFSKNNVDKNHPRTVNKMGVQNILAAMEQTGTRKLVRITGALVGKPNSPVAVLFNLLLSFTVKYHEAAEIAIRESGVDYLVVRPTELKDEPPARETNRVLVCLPPGSKQKLPLPGKISIVDLAELCVASVTNASDFPQRTTLIVSSAENGHKALRGGAATVAYSFEAIGPSLAEDSDKLVKGPHRRNALIAIATIATLLASLVSKILSLLRMIM